MIKFFYFFNKSLSKLCSLKLKFLYFKSKYTSLVFCLVVVIKLIFILFFKRLIINFLAYLSKTKTKINLFHALTCKIFFCLLVIGFSSFLSFLLDKLDKSFLISCQNYSIIFSILLNLFHGNVFALVIF